MFPDPLLEADLSRALDRDELLLDYQPQVDARTGRVVAVEALLRWRHPERGLISPAVFIPAAERSGLIVPIGDWVLRAACLQSRRWLDAGLAPVRMAVNLSARQFSDDRLARRVEESLDGAGLEPPDLELEITESMMAWDLRLRRPDRGRAARLRRAPDDRRLRHRLFVPGFAQALSGRRAQARPSLRRAPAPRPSRRDDHAGGRRDRARSRSRSRRRGRRDGRPEALPRRPRLRAPSGLPHRQAPVARPPGRAPQAVPPAPSRGPGAEPAPARSWRRAR